MAAGTPPQLGASVIFFAPVEEGGSGFVPGDARGEQYAAIVTRVHPTGRVDLVTFGPNSVYFQHDIAWGNASDPMGPCWIWPGLR